MHIKNDLIIQILELFLLGSFLFGSTPGDQLIPLNLKNNLSHQKKSFMNN